jgi:electron transfer flavoprotein beta subunit
MTFADMPDQDLSRYGLVGSPTSVERMFAPPEAEKQVYLSGDATMKADQLVDLLIEKKVI